MTLKRETIFDIVTDPPCCYCELLAGRKVCEFWDVQGHYCFLKNIHSDTEKCLLVDKIIEAHKAVIKSLLKEIENERFATPQHIAESGREPVIICLTEVDLQALKQKYGGE